MGRIEKSLGDIHAESTYIHFQKRLKLDVEITSFLEEKQKQRKKVVA